MTSQYPAVPGRQLAPGDRVLVVGAGLAGTLVASGLREAAWDGELTVVGEEAHPPYHRPPLSKGKLKAEGATEDVTLRGADFWEQQRITLVLGDAITDLGLNASGAAGAGGGRARTAGGRELPYDRLVLATGAAPRSLPAVHGLTGVHQVRSLADAEALRPALVAGASVVVIGAGFIGLEVAATARSAGASVTVLEAGERALNRVIGPLTAERIAAHHREAGIDLRCAAQVVDIRQEDGRVRGLGLADGTDLPADVVVLGIGADPVTDLAEKAGLRVERGIVVSPDQLASDGTTVAVGDCSIGWGGLQVRLESVDHATQSAAMAVATLLGIDAPASLPPWFWSDQGDLKLQVVGLVDATCDVVVREDPARGRFAAVYLRDGVPIAAEVLNAPADFMALRRAVAAGVRWDADQQAALADPGVKINSLL